LITVVFAHYTVAAWMLFSVCADGQVSEPDAIFRPSWSYRK